VGLREEGWKLVREMGASVIWCPRSNIFTLGQTFNFSAAGVPIALGTDSPITACGDLLDELRFVNEKFGVDECSLRALVGSQAQRILHLAQRPEDWIAATAFGDPPELVVIGGQIRLISPRLAGEMAISEFSPIQIEGRPRVLVRMDTKQLIERTIAFLDSPICLGGRHVSVD
jgi:hypothetical protein